MGPPRGALAHLDTIVRDHVTPALRDAGAKGGLRGPWRLGGPQDGWVVVAVQRDRWNSKAEAGLWVLLGVWPRGTFERFRENAPTNGEKYPFAAGGAPLQGWPTVVLGPDADPNAHSIELRSDSTPAEVTAAGESLTAYLRAALTWGLAHRDPELAAEHALHSGADLAYAAATLRAARPDSPLLATVLDTLTARFQRDPRPIELAPELARWRADAGLPEVRLPWCWHQAMLGPQHRSESPRADFQAGLGTALRMCFADGSDREVSPVDLPDVSMLRRWAEQRAASPVGDGVVMNPPDWLVWERWLDLPEVPQPPPPRQRRLRVPKMLRAISRPITAAADRAT